MHMHAYTPSLLVIAICAETDKIFISPALSDSLLLLLLIMNSSSALKAPRSLSHFIALRTH